MIRPTTKCRTCFLAILYILLCTLRSCHNAKYKLEKSIQVYRIEVCSMNDELDMKISRLERINKKKGNIVAIVELLVGKNIKRLYANLKVERCTEADVLKSCEHFLKLTELDMCSGLNYQLMISTFYKLYEPNLSCPVKPGEYKLKNMTTDQSLSVLNRFITPDSRYYWKINIKITDGEKKVVFCMKYIIKIYDRRVKI